MRNRSPGRLPLIFLWTALLVLILTVPARANHKQPSPPAFPDVQNFRSLANFDFDPEAYPHRLTGSPESNHFLWHVNNLLQDYGWFPEIQGYAALAQTYSKETNRTTFLRAQGENLLAFNKEEPGRIIELLVVAPYDVLWVENQLSENRSFTAKSCAVLMEFCRRLNIDVFSGEPVGSSIVPANVSREMTAGLSAVATQPGAEPKEPTVAVAFVSGHHQLGVGMQALVENLTENDYRVGGVVVLGDLFSHEPLPVVPHPSAPVIAVENILAALKPDFPDAFLAGGRNRAAWLQAATKGPEPGAAEISLDDGTFLGEGAIIGAIAPTVTLGLPTANHFRAGSSGQSAVSEASVPETRAGKLVDALLTIARGTGFTSLEESDANAMGEQGLGLSDGPHSPAYGQTTATVLRGKTYLVESKFLAYIGVGAGIAAALAVSLNSALLEDKSALGWVAGALVASLLAQSIRFLCFRSPLAKYVPWVRHKTPALTFFLMFFLIITAAFLRIWAVRSRIANLKVRAGAMMAGSKAAASTSGGIWGLAIMGGLCAGMGFAGSPMLFASAIATAGLLLAVLLERFCISQTRKDLPLPAIVSWLMGGLYLTPLIPGLLWIGASWSEITLESIAAPLCIGVAAGCFFSANEFPGPVIPRKIQFLNIGSLAALALVLVVGFIMGNRAVLLYPVSIVEEFGTGTNVTILSTKPLGNVLLGQEPCSPVETDKIPSNLIDRSGRVRISFPDVNAPPWATIDGHAERDQSGQATKDTRDRTELPFITEACFSKQPTFFSIEAKDIPITTRDYKPLELMQSGNMLNSLLESLEKATGAGSEGVPVARFRNEPAISYSKGHRIRIILWYPPEDKLETTLWLAAYGVNQIEFVTHAVYLDDSYIGVTLEDPPEQIIRYVKIAGPKLQK